MIGDRQGRQARRITENRQTDRQAGGQTVRQMGRKAELGTGRVSRLVEIQKTDRQAGRHECRQSDSQTTRKAGLGTGMVGRLEEDRNRTDKQAGISAHCQTDGQKMGFWTGKVGRQKRRQKMDRQAGGRPTDRWTEWQWWDRQGR